MEKQPCKICTDETTNLFNINFVATPICDHCANAIFIQQANWFIGRKMSETEKKNTLALQRNG